jgi:hypothetical protein
MTSTLTKPSSATVLTTTRVDSASTAAATAVKGSLPGAAEAREGPLVPQMKQVRFPMQSKVYEHAGLAWGVSGLLLVTAFVAFRRNSDHPRVTFGAWRRVSAVAEEPVQAASSMTVPEHTDWRELRTP